MKRTSWLVLLLLIVAGRTLAQVDCPAIVDAALELTADACVGLARNQACYGNVTLEAEPQEGASFTFEQTGDMVNLVDVASLHLSPMDTETVSWGVALLLLQANLPDSLPGQNVTMVLFGQVEMANAVSRTAEATPEPTPVVLQINVSSSINVRGGPSTTDAVVASLGSGDSATADGRNEDGTWLHIQLSDGSAGWVFAELVSLDGDVSQLPVIGGGAVEATAEVSTPIYTPMQAFYFSSSIGDSGCEQAPDSGILIQTPQGVGTINLLINEVEITLGSTAYMTAGEGEMIVSVIEGQGTVSAFGVTVVAPAGTRVRIPLDANGVASGTPIGPEPYDTSALNALPVVLLPQQVAIAVPLTEEEIAALGVELALGDWTFTLNVTDVCPEHYDMVPSLIGSQAYPVSHPSTYEFLFDISQYQNSITDQIRASITNNVLMYISALYQRDGGHFPISRSFTDDYTSPGGSICNQSSATDIEWSQQIVFIVLSATHIEGTFAYTYTSSDAVGTFTFNADE